MFTNYEKYEMELIPELEALFHEDYETKPSPVKKTLCFAPAVSKTDPVALNISAAGNLDYNGGNVQLLGNSYTVSGSVFYPAKTAGTGKPFNATAVKNRPAPVLFFAHGNHQVFYDSKDRNNESCGYKTGYNVLNNHKGYEYLQLTLAQMGFIVVSVNCNQTNCASQDETNITTRALLILESVRHFQSLHKGKTSVFSGRIDFTRMGLMGHSRGGEAVLLAAELLGRSNTGINGVSIKGIISLAPTDTKTLLDRPKGCAFMTILPAGDGDVVSNDGAKFYDEAIPSPFKCQLYVHKANHHFFNREWVSDDGIGPAVMTKAEHERILSVYSSAFFRQVLLGDSFMKLLTGEELPPAVTNANIHMSFELKSGFTVDDHENGNINLNALGQSTSQSGGLKADEYVFAFRAGGYNDSFFGNTIGMVATSPSAAGFFRSSLSSLTDLSSREIWIRAAEVYSGSVPPNTTGFKIGVEDSSGNTAFIDSDDAGGLPRPYDRKTGDVSAGRPDLTKTMLKTLRFPTPCFKQDSTKINLKKIKAILLKLDRKDGRALAFDQLQILS